MGIALCVLLRGERDCQHERGSRCPEGYVHRSDFLPADETQLEISLAHFPSGTSKWNKIEHRLFSHITQNWRGKPLISHEVIVNLIAATTTRAGLHVRSDLDTNSYPSGLRISADQMQELRIHRDEFHGEWNYTILPRKPDRIDRLICDDA
jgi:hypothetical protein